MVSEVNPCEQQPSWMLAAAGRTKKVDIDAVVNEVNSTMANIFLEERDVTLIEKDCRSYAVQPGQRAVLPHGRGLMKGND
jgi:hypothetical protein